MSICSLDSLVIFGGCYGGGEWVGGRRKKKMGNSQCHVLI